MKYDKKISEYSAMFISPTSYVSTGTQSWTRIQETSDVLDGPITTFYVGFKTCIVSKAWRFQKTKDWATLTHFKSGRGICCTGRVSSSCTTIVIYFRLVRMCKTILVWMKYSLQLRKCICSVWKPVWNSINMSSNRPLR